MHCDQMVGFVVCLSSVGFGNGGEMSVFGRESDSIEGDFEDEVRSPFLQYCSCLKKHRRGHSRFIFCCEVRENFKGGRRLAPSATTRDVPTELILLCPISRPCHLGDHRSQFFFLPLFWANFGHPSSNPKSLKLLLSSNAALLGILRSSFSSHAKNLLETPAVILQARLPRTARSGRRPLRSY